MGAVCSGGSRHGSKAKLKRVRVNESGRKKKKKKNAYPMLMAVVMV